MLAVFRKEIICRRVDFLDDIRARIQPRYDNDAGFIRCIPADDGTGVAGNILADLPHLERRACQQFRGIRVRLFNDNAVQRVVRDFLPNAIIAAVSNFYAVPCWLCGCPTSGSARVIRFLRSVCCTMIDIIIFVGYTCAGFRILDTRQIRIFPRRKVFPCNRVFRQAHALCRPDFRNHVPAGVNVLQNNLPVFIRFECSQRDYAAVFGFPLDFENRIRYRLLRQHVCFRDDKGGLFRILINERFRFACFKLNFLMLGVEDIACWRGDFLNGIDTLGQIFNHNLSGFVRQVFADSVILRMDYLKFRTCQRLFRLAIYLLDFQHRVFRIAEHERFRLAPFQRDVLMVFGVDTVALWSLDFLDCVDSFVQIVNQDNARFVCHVFADGLILCFCYYFRMRI